MKLHKIIKWLAIALATAATVLAIERMNTLTHFSSYPLSPKGEVLALEISAIPSEWAKCMPTDLSVDDLSEAEWLGEHQSEHSLFAIWEIEDNGIPFLFVNTLFGGRNGSCGHIFDSRYERIMSPDYITPENARAVSVVFYERKIEEAGGLANFQANIDESLAEPGPVYFSPEFLYAMRQLGVHLPEDDVQILDANTPPPSERRP